MKKFLLLIIISFSISCANAKVANAIWYFLSKTSASITENEDISVVYGIYTKYSNLGIGDKTGVGGEAPFPTMRIMLTNKSNKIIYVDLGTSFIKKNNVASVIYTPTVISSMIGQSFGTSINVGSVAKSIGIGGFVGTAMGGINIGGGVSSSTTTSTYAQRFISIPPKSAVFLEDIPILTPGSEKALGDMFYYREIGMGKLKWTGCFSPKFSDLESEEIIDFSEDNTLFTIGAFLNYSFSDDFKETKSIETTYYVKRMVGSTWGYMFGTVSDKEFNIIDKTFPEWREEVKSGNLEIIRLWAK
ncbi:MAG: hypothetical protein E7141_07005 [Rikenellaceae bacterium]|nr:hypothetical protein [Rikenellaceae bacterium]